MICKMCPSSQAVPSVYCMLPAQLPEKSGGLTFPDSRFIDQMIPIKKR